MHESLSTKEVAALGGGCFWCPEAVIAEFNATKIRTDPIVTEVAPFNIFYMAENYHQDYFKNNPNQPYCQIIVAPKVAKFRKQFRNKHKT